MAGIDGVTGNKTTLELDFRRAWRRWPYAHHFPAVKAGPAQDDVLNIMSMSPRRRSPIAAEWQGQWPFVPVLINDDWTTDEVADIIHEDIPAEAWEQLVRAWLSLD